MFSLRMLCLMRTVRSTCVLLIFLIVLLLSNTGSLQANSLQNQVTVLTRENIVNQALNHFAAIQQSQLQLRSQVAQLGYLQAQRNIEETSLTPLRPSFYPTSMEELINSIPDYDQLTDDQKQQLESVLAIQSMINASLNQYIDAQVKQQNAVLLYQQQQNLKSIDEQLRAATFDVQISVMEIEKTKRLVQYNALQSVYQIMLLLKDLEGAELEEAYLEQSYLDAQFLYENGKLTSQETEKARLQWTNQHKQVEELSQQLEFRKKLFKFDLGYKDDQTIKFPDEITDISLEEEAVNSDIQLSDQIDLKKAAASIKQAELNYDKAKNDNSALANYYLSVISIENDNKTLVERQLEKRMEEFKAEEQSLLDQLDRLQEELSQVIQSKNDLKKLFANGLVTGREVEAIEFEVAQINLAVDKARIGYEIWKEKKWAAVHGVLI